LFDDLFLFLVPVKESKTFQDELYTPPHLLIKQRDNSRRLCSTVHTPWHYNFHEPNSSVTWHLIWPPFSY